MKNKKVLSAILTGTMALAMAVPAFASGSGTGSTNALAPSAIDVTGTVKTPTISVTLNGSSNTGLLLNPYGITVKASTTNGAEDTTNGTNTTAQIIYPRQTITSGCNVPLKVSYSITGTPEGNLKLGTASFANDTKTTTNSVFLFFDIAAIEETGASAPNAEAKEAALPGTYDKTKTTQVIVGTKAVTKSNAITIPAATGEGLVNKGYAVYGLFGDAVKSPTTAWADTDKVKVSIAFTFTPDIVPPSD